MKTEIYKIIQIKEIGLKLFLDKSRETTMRNNYIFSAQSRMLLWHGRADYFDRKLHLLSLGVVLVSNRNILTKDELYTSLHTR